MNDPIDMCLAASLRFARLPRPSVASPRMAPRGALSTRTPTPISCWFLSPRSPSFLKPHFPPSSRDPRWLCLRFGSPVSPAAAARRGLRLMQRVVTNLRQQLHILQENWFSDHTDDFLASCAVVVSSLPPPFAKTIKCKSRGMQLRDTLNEKVINISHQQT